MKFYGLHIVVLATHVHHRFAQTNRGSTNTTKDTFHALLLPSEDYLLHGRRPGHS